MESGGDVANPKGLYCPNCRGVRLTFHRTYKPCPGVTFRYRRCSACHLRIKTKEIIVAYTYPRPR